MSDQQHDVGPPAPQRPETPFTGRDLVRQTFSAWAVSVVGAATWITGSWLLSAGGPVSTSGSIVPIVVVGYAVISLVLFWVFAPLALILGRALRHVRPVRTHVLAFAGLGTAVCFVVVLAGELGLGVFEILSGPVGWLAAVGAGLCTGAGRFWAFRARRRRNG
ncbi:MAG: hypothetical protein J0J04_07920 [Microbacterium sp.]|uniref:hypothetical protein n=1 Tax=Microbacterium sp. TaxID=51671 RepID=UPI001AC7207A|nr:hypothetical protein [Microbacterium sp.]MBN9214726.1 hypothetical protein [Microbacterium sp.]